MAEAKKDTIYIDVDDEITGIIDKLRNSSGQVTALVLPKRAGVFQSIVNMKLLKRAAEQASKHLVLVTSEAGLLPLAGAAGIHVAKTINSKPEIPMAPKLDDAAEEAIDESGMAQEITAATAGKEPVGKLADQGAAAAVGADGVETLALDDDEVPEDAPASSSAAKKPKSFTPPASKDKGKSGDKAKKDSKLKIPNFKKFRLQLIIAGIVILLIIAAIILAAIVLPKATINVKTNASNVPVSLDLNLSTSASSLDTSSTMPTVPAKLESVQKTYSQQVPTTGQKNEGSEASGTVTMTAQECAPNLGTPPDVPAGTGLTANGLTYITQQDTTFGNFQPGHGSCETFQESGSTSITAQNGGSNYNTGNGSSFTVAGRSDVSASGSASGGSDNIVQTVNQNDITSAKAKISTNDNTQQQYLQNQLKQDGYFAITSTFSAGTPNVTQSAQVGDVATSVTVTEVATYTMFGAHQSDLDTLVDGAVKNQVNTNQQSILSEGVNTAIFGVNSTSSNSAQLTMQATAEVGPAINTSAIIQSALGKKPADVQAQLQNDPNITKVNVSLSPFWVNSVPKKASKVTVVIAKPTKTASNANANNP